MTNDVDSLREAVHFSPANLSRDAAIPIGGGLKRALDIVITLPLILFFLPLFLLLALAVWVQGDGPIIFSHGRVGFDGNEFRCLKFRSMVANAQQRLTKLLEEDPEALAEWNATHKLKNDPRITRLGQFLRKSSLDELPQLFNILKGEMSLIGPRPITWSEVSQYEGSFADYTRTRPGLTGLWQVSGRSDLSYRERVMLDVAYVRNWSFVGDLMILLRTVPAILLRRGSY
jgi:exopolysaccharide production protein ExoY